MLVGMGVWSRVRVQVNVVINDITVAVILAHCTETHLAPSCEEQSFWNISGLCACAFGLSW